RAVAGEGALGIERYAFVGPARIALDRLAFNRVDGVEVRVGTYARRTIEATHGQHANLGRTSPGDDDFVGLAPFAEMSGAHHGDFVLVCRAEIMVQPLVIVLHDKTV